MLTLYRPCMEDLWFRQKMLEDPATMSYNLAWGGTVPFPPERWEAWYQKWLCADEALRFYRYLAAGETFVGEVAYHREDGGDRVLTDVVIHAPLRGRGYGGEGLELLCEAARAHGITELWDSVAEDNPALGLFLRRGFAVTDRESGIVTLHKRLTKSDI